MHIKHKYKAGRPPKGERRDVPARNMLIQCEFCNAILQRREFIRHYDRKTC